MTLHGEPSFSRRKLFSSLWEQEDEPPKETFTHHHRHDARVTVTGVVEEGMSKFLFCNETDLIS